MQKFKSALSATFYVELFVQLTSFAIINISETFVEVDQRSYARTLLKEAGED